MRTRIKTARRTRRALCAITTTAAGIVTYRTRKPLPEARAFSFAAAVAANGKFLDATVTRSRKANHYHVCFIPANADRIAAMLTAEDNKDVQAANRDGSNFVYREVAPGVFQCVGITGTYTVFVNGTGGGSCDCPHFKYRRSSCAGRCKHMVELSRRIEAGLIDA
jgi:hypothetical protein